MTKKKIKIDTNSLIEQFGMKPYKLRVKEKYMSKRQLNHFKKILNSWKGQLEQEAEKTVNNMQKDSNSLADPNDRATQESEFGLELRTRDRERKLIRKIQSSLIKIDDGTFGYCEETGEPIGLKRLMARPVAHLCIAAQEKHEKDEKVFADD